MGEKIHQRDIEVIIAPHLSRYESLFLNNNVPPKRVRQQKCVVKEVLSC